jgi:2-oxoisovalerate dehydrogenase E2 component (dihydrolipoyl transacylase)
VAILGIGRIMDRAWVVAGAVVVRPVETLSLAYDHRVCDGRDAAAFLGFVRENIEAPTAVFGET